RDCAWLRQHRVAQGSHQQHLAPQCDRDDRYPPRALRLREERRVEGPDHLLARLVERSARHPQTDRDRQEPTNTDRTPEARNSVAQSQQGSRSAQVSRRLVEAVTRPFRLEAGYRSLLNGISSTLNMCMSSRRGETCRTSN